jgi:hypothetical protein
MIYHDVNLFNYVFMSYFIDLCITVKVVAKKLLMKVSV